MALFTPRKCVRTLMLLIIVLFLMSNFLFFTPSKNQLSGNDLEIRPIKNLRINSSAKEILNGNDLPKKPEEMQANESRSDGAIEESEKKHRNGFNESLSFIINDINSKQEIRNADKFPAKVNGTYEHVLVVQVHNRDQYFQALVNSLEKVRGINSTLLIISHDFYSEPIFKIISTIDFMPVMQIFYPKCMQLYRDVYPGEDPNDCPRDIKKPEAIKRKCNNAEYPDTFGHYREAKYAQTKLHWFWKLHHVFDELSIMKKYEGRIMLLEEDHYVTPDALYMLDSMSAAIPSVCPKCRILTLGNYDKKPSYAFHNEVVPAPEFISSKHNMAMCFNRTVFNIIKQYKKEFCNFDDYNWDWSLQQIGHFDVPDKLPTLIVKTPRVHHIGECGVHHKGGKTGCDPAGKVSIVNKLVESNLAKLYPETLAIGKSTAVTYITIKKMRPSGGWSDVRDHELCASFMGV